MVLLTCKMYLYQEIDHSSWHFLFSAGAEVRVTWHTGLSQWWPLSVDSQRLIARSQKSKPNVWNTSDYIMAGCAFVNAKGSFIMEMVVFWHCDNG